MVSLPSWGGRWDHRERLESDGSEIAKNRYKPGHPRVHQTTKPRRGEAGEAAYISIGEKFLTVEAPLTMVASLAMFSRTE